MPCVWVSPWRIRVGEHVTGCAFKMGYNDAAQTSSHQQAGNRPPCRPADYQGRSTWGQMLTRGGSLSGGDTLVRGRSIKEQGPADARPGQSPNHSWALRPKEPKNQKAPAKHTQDQRGSSRVLGPEPLHQGRAHRKRRDHKALEIKLYTFKDGGFKYILMRICESPLVFTTISM